MADSEVRGESVVETEGSRPQVVLSPSDLLEHLLRMTDSLEQAWSEGLENEAARKARREAKTLWSAFITQYLDRIEWVRSLDEQLGLNTLSEGIPLSDEALARLTLDPLNSESRYRQLALASSYVMFDLMEALGGLDNPKGVRFALFSGSVTETWWEGGAFVLIRRRAKALAQILRAQEDCLKELADSREGVPSLPNPSLSERAPWSAPLRAASDLVAQDYCDAALPLLLQALRLVIASAASVEARFLPVPLSPVLDKVAGLESMVRPVALLEAAAERLSKGHQVDAGVAVPLAKEILARIHRLAVNPPAPYVWEQSKADLNG